jgi:GT2 family glycosyltransferase
LALAGKDPKENISQRHRRKEFFMTQPSHTNAPTQFMDIANFAARDENVRCLSYGVLRKLAGLPRDLFADYWRDVLGPLRARLPGISYYVQCHFSPGHWAKGMLINNLVTF